MSSTGLSFALLTPLPLSGSQRPSFNCVIWRDTAGPVHFGRGVAGDVADVGIHGRRIRSIEHDQRTRGAAGELRRFAHVQHEVALAAIAHEAGQVGSPSPDVGCAVADEKLCCKGGAVDEVAVTVSGASVPATGAPVPPRFAN